MSNEVMQKTGRSEAIIVVEEIDVTDVINNDKAKYNSNNHWENEVMPSDYYEVISQGELSKWVDRFKTYQKIEIHPREYPWLVEASNSGKFTGRFPGTCKEELYDLIASHPTGDLFNGRGYFVRCNNVSLKCGMHGSGPYYDLKSIVESSVTCIHGHSPVYPGISKLTFYLIEWVKITPDREFRMFVCNNRVTAISQQYTTRRNKELTGEENRERKAQEWVKILLEYWATEIQPRITHISSYTIDIAILDDGRPYFIEINCFGKEYAAGSSLFHWLLDKEKLYGHQANTVFFRYAV